MATPAEQLNDKWDALSSSLNNYPQLTRAQNDAISKAISNWQDWYYNDANYGKWGDISEWTISYNNALAALKHVVKHRKLKPKAPVVSKPSQDVHVLPPVYITAKPPGKDWTWYIVAGVAVLLIGGYYYFNHHKKGHVV